MKKRPGFPGFFLFVHELARIDTNGLYDLVASRTLRIPSVLLARCSLGESGLRFIFCCFNHRVRGEWIYGIDLSLISSFLCVLCGLLILSLKFSHDGLDTILGITEQHPGIFIKEQFILDSGKTGCH